MAGILREQCASGLSVAAFCRRARVPQASFYAWRRKLRNVPVQSNGPDPRRSGVKPSRGSAVLRGSKTAGFVEVKLPGGLPEAVDRARAQPWVEWLAASAVGTQAGEIELRLPGRRCLVIRPGFDRQTLLDLLATLEAGVVESGTRMAFASGFALHEVVA